MVVALIVSGITRALIGRRLTITKTSGAPAVKVRLRNFACIYDLVSRPLALARWGRGRVTCEPPSRCSRSSRTSRIRRARTARPCARRRASISQASSPCTSPPTTRCRWAPPRRAHCTSSGPTACRTSATLSACARRAGWAARRRAPTTPGRSRAPSPPPIRPSRAARARPRTTCRSSQISARS